MMDGLKVASQVLADKIIALPRDKCGPPIGRLDTPEIMALSRMRSVVLGIAD